MSVDPHKLPEEVQQVLRDRQAGRKSSPALLAKFNAIMEQLAEKTGLGRKTWYSPGAMAFDLSHRLHGIPKWNHARHVDLLDQWLVDLFCGDKDQILVSFPPRHGKTELLGFWTPLHYLHKNPTKHVMFITHGDDTARLRGARVRNFINEYGRELGLKLQSGSSDRSHWFLESGGSMRSIGTGGQIRGLPADLLIGDDLVKGMEQALSEVERKKLMEWWQGDAINRLEPGAKIILIGSRYHEADIMGTLERLSDRGFGMKFWSFKLPAIIETEEEAANDLLGRKIGEVLWPERIDRDFLLRLKAGTSGDPDFDMMNPYLWGAVFQQNPTPEEGASIKPSWWKYYTKINLEELDETLQSWDMTFKDTTKADFVVGQVWGRKGAEYYLLDQVRQRMNFPKTIQAIRDLKSKWPATGYIIIEETANGPAVIQSLHSEIPGIFPEKTPSTSKEARVQSIAYAIESGNVFLPSQAPWLQDFIHEFSLFPNATYDDQVDAASQALKYLTQRGVTVKGRAHRSAIEQNYDTKPGDTEALLTREFHRWMDREERRNIRRIQRSPEFKPLRLSGRFRPL